MGKLVRTLFRSTAGPVSSKLSMQDDSTYQTSASLRTYQSTRNHSFKPVQKVRFADAPTNIKPHSTTRRALRNIKEATNRRLHSIKSHCRGNATPGSGIRQAALGYEIDSPESIETKWISDAASEFGNRSYRSCLRTAKSLESLFDSRSIMDISVEHALIDTIWRPLQPEPFKLHCDLEGLFSS